MHLFYFFIIYCILSNTEIDFFIPFCFDACSYFWEYRQVIRGLYLYDCIEHLRYKIVKRSDFDANRWPKSSSFGKETYIVVITAKEFEILVFQSEIVYLVITVQNFLADVNRFLRDKYPPSISLLFVYLLFLKLQKNVWFDILSEYKSIYTAFWVS